MIEIEVVGIQVLFPLLLLAWLWLAPLQSRVGFSVQALAVLMALLALALTVPWIVPPWWTAHVYLATGVAASWARGPGVWRRGPVLPAAAVERVATVVLLPLLVCATLLTAQAWSGRSLDSDQEAVDLAFPLSSGTYLVANGGSHPRVNAHYLTLDPQTQRQRAYRGQSFAVDLVQIDPWGFRATRWRPAEPSAYRIFRQAVLAPCEGVVLATRSDMPDMRVPKPDRSLLEGNHVFINCAEFAVLLAHLREGSVAVTAGERVRAGQKVAEVGNTGQSFEPHLHIHAQHLAEEGEARLSGEPLHLTFDGLLPVRNARITVGVAAVREKN